MRLFHVSILLLLGGLIVLAEPVNELWTQWRGPNRDGSAPEQSWPDSLKGLERIWRVELGPGYPGPIVAEDRVFVAETVNEDTEVVRALDRASGKELWRASWPGEASVPFFAARNGDWIRSTPTYDGETLYIGGMNELFFAFDAMTGKERWRVDFPERYDVDPPDFGFASSPLVDGTAIYIQAANSVVKLDKRTGKQIWRALETRENMFESGAFSSPILADLAGRRQLIVQTRYELLGIDPSGGEVLWSHEVPNFRGMNILTPSIYGDGIFTSTHRNMSYFYSVEATGRGFEVEETWTNKAKGYMSTPVIIGDYAYLHQGNRRFVCLDLRDGSTRWTTTPFGDYWSMAMQGDKILALDSAGKLLLIQADPNQFRLLDQAEVSDQETWAHVAVAGGQIFVRELEAIAAYAWNED